MRWRNLSPLCQTIAGSVRGTVNSPADIEQDRPLEGQGTRETKTDHSAIKCAWIETHIIQVTHKAE